MTSQSTLASKFVPDIVIALIIYSPSISRGKNIAHGTCFEHGRGQCNIYSERYKSWQPSCFLPKGLVKGSNQTTTVTNHHPYLILKQLQKARILQYFQIARKTQPSYHIQANKRSINPITFKENSDNKAVVGLGRAFYRIFPGSNSMCHRT